MINKYYGINCTSNILIIVSFVLSCFLHIFCVSLTIYNSFFYTKINPSTTTKNYKIITLLSSNYIDTKKVLEKKHSLKISKTIPYSQTIQPSIQQTSKILDNFTNSSRTTDDACNINENSNMDSNDNIFSESDLSEFNHNTNDTTHSTSRIIKYFHPKYPNKAKLLGIEGELSVMYNINVMGRVEKIRILSSIPVQVFEESVKLAMRRWIYEKNQPKQNLTIIFKFSLNTIQISSK